MSKGWWLAAGLSAAALCAAQEPAQRPPSFWDAVKQGVKDTAKKAVIDSVTRPSAPASPTPSPAPLPAAATPAAAGPAGAATAAGSEGRAAALPPPLRLSGGELAATVLVPETRLKPLYAITFNGVPAVIAIKGHARIDPFLRAFADATLSERARKAAHRMGAADASASRGLARYMVMAQTIAQAGENTSIFTQNLVLDELEPAFLSRFVPCAAIERERDPACASWSFVLGEKMWRGDDEFERRRTRDAYLAEVPPALRTAFARPALQLAVLEERSLGAYDERRGGFFMTAMISGGAAINCSPDTSRSDGELSCQIQNLVSMRVREEQLLLRAPPAEAEAVVRSLQQSNRAAGRPERRILTRALLRCDRGAGAVGRGFACELASMEAFSDDELSQPLLRKAR